MTKQSAEQTPTSKQQAGGPGLGLGADPCAGHLLHGEQRRLDVARVEVQASVGEIPWEVLDALRVERRGGVGDGRQREKSLLEPATQRSVGAKSSVTQSHPR